MSATIFRYAARNAEWELIRGAIEAASADDVIANLRSRALFITAVERENPLARGAGLSLRLGLPSRRALLAFFRSFATLVRAGVPLRRALGVTIDRAGDAVLKEALRSIAADVEHGSSLSAAFARRPRVFAPLHVAMIRAGESGGILDDVLDRLAGFLERDDALRKKLRAALAYPAIVTVAAGGLTAFLLLRIVPMFAQMFDAFHVELPLSTRMLLALSTALQHPAAWAAATAGAAAAAALAVWTMKTRRGSLAGDALRLRLPIVSPLLHRAITARVARTLSTLLRAGVELVAAIEIVRPVAGSARYAEALGRVDVAVREGETLTDALAQTRLFDPLAVALVGIGEETGQLDEMLLTVARYFEADVEAAIATLGAAVEPIMIGVLGVVVGFIVFSVFLPLYSLIGSVSR
ncbi:MAG TPA: type II secretion system F family protein [Candidatus Elarobacter sp.]